MDFKFIISDPAILNGKPIIKGSRISVQLILEWIASGANINDIIVEFPYLTIEGVKEAVLYASRFMDNDILIQVKEKSA
jgi:uncharacterized protein (DUF433 family)